MKHLSIIIILILALFCVQLNTYCVQAWDEVWEMEIFPHRQGLSDWDSVLELEVFLALDDAPLVLVADSTGKISFEGQCEDFAFQLRDRARLWGRNLDVEILTPQEFRQYYGRSGGYHAINKAVIGNEWWYVDKQENKLWHVLNLD